MVKRRHVYHVAGYDPIDADALYRRFTRQLDTFRRTWSVDATSSGLEQSDKESRAWWTVTARAGDWQVEAVHEALLWDDIVRGDFKRALPARLLDAARVYLDYIATGTMFRYVAANPRYATFFLFPVFALALFAVAGWLVARLLTGWGGLEGVAAAAVGLVVGLAVFYVLLQWPGRRWRVEQLLDDWICAHDYLRGRRPDIDARLERFADALVARSRAGGADEIVLVGHSLGAMLVLDLLVRALARDGDLGRRGAALCVLTVGATIPKFALHPRAQEMRRKIARIAAEPSIAWTEYQSRDDTISFYKFDPVALRRIPGDRLDGKPVIRRVQIHDMLQPETFARCRRNVLRLHYRSVMANDRRAPYDYFMMVAGPVPFSAWTTSPAGLLDFIAADGSCRGSSERAAAATPASA
jgi:pimeloyl-ACP methyl ester carboxylesterase